MRDRTTGLEHQPNPALDQLLGVFLGRGIYGGSPDPRTDRPRNRASVKPGLAHCDPKSPRQRGTNENTNGLLRQYFPKSTDLATVTALDLDRVADELNDRPRKRLGFYNPNERLAELLLR
jgi:hypothetical protein